MNLTLGIIISCILALMCARWYENNKLFWILFTSLMVGIVGGSIYANSRDDSSKSEKLQQIEVLKDSVSKIQRDSVLSMNNTLIANVVTSNNSKSNFKHLKKYQALTSGYVNIIKQPPRFNHFRLCTIDSTTHHDSEA